MSWSNPAASRLETRPLPPTPMPWQCRACYGCYLELIGLIQDGEPCTLNPTPKTPKPLNPKP